MQDRHASATLPAAPSPTTPRPNGVSSNPTTIQLKPFTGAVAGKVVTLDGDPDIGAPPELAFFPAWMADQAQQYRNTLTGPAFVEARRMGWRRCVNAAEQAALTGDHRSAMQKYEAAVSVLPDDGELWLALARETLAVQPADSHGNLDLPGQRHFRRLQRLPAVAHHHHPRRSAGAAGAGLDKRDLYRPALQAYEASLCAGQVRASVRADYDDLKARKGFRVIDHTVDADTSAPRICAQFSEDLVKTGVDYAPVRHRRRRRRPRASRPRTSRSASRGSNTASITT